MQIVRPDFVMFQKFKDQIACLHYIYNAEKCNDYDGDWWKV